MDVTAGMLCGSSDKACHPHAEVCHPLELRSCPIGLRAGFDDDLLITDLDLVNSEFEIPADFDDFAGATAGLAYPRA
eukprot:scaffold2045_cov404-Prasinococcus_capsulatus_cf.AAC.8